MLEAEADNLLVALTNGSIYPRNIVDSYRFRVDNREYSNNDVVRAGPEHFDNLNMLFMNMDLDLKTISDVAMSQLKNEDKTNDLSQTLSLIGVPLPKTAQPKILNLKMARAGMTEIVLFKRMVKSI